MEEIKSSPKNIIFATLTFSEESLKKLEYDEQEPNKTPQKAISLFRKRWWKKYKAPLKHWLITELGHDYNKGILQIFYDVTDRVNLEYGYDSEKIYTNIVERPIAEPMSDDDDSSVLS